MKTLIVYFTRTGTTEIAAKALQTKLQCDIEKIIDHKDWSGPIGWLAAGRQALKKNLTEIEEAKFEPAGYDLVIIGTPVWAGLCPPAIRTYISRHKEQFKKIAFFTTQGSAKRQKVFDDLKDQIGIAPLSELHLQTKEVRGDAYMEKLEEFVLKFKA